MKRVYLEITNACNLNCPFCSYEKGHDYLTLQQIDDCLDQIKPFCGYVYLHILGEPLLHPDFDRIMDLLDEKQMKVQLVTNGTLLEKHKDMLEHPSLRKLSISLHSISSLDVDPSYFTVIDEMIADSKGKIIELRFYQTGIDRKLQDYLTRLDEEYTIKTSDRNDSYRLKENVYIKKAALFKWPDINDPIIGEDGTCHGGIDMIAINSRLEVTLCCLDPKAHNRLGDLHETSLAEILDSVEYKRVVKELKEHKISCDLCKRCTYRLRFR